MCEGDLVVGSVSECFKIQSSVFKEAVSIAEDITEDDDEWFVVKKLYRRATLALA